MSRNNSIIHNQIAWNLVCDYFCSRPCTIYLLASRSFSDVNLQLTKHRRVLNSIVMELCQVFPKINSCIWVLPFSHFSSYCSISIVIPWVSSCTILGVVCCLVEEPQPTTSCIQSLRSRKSYKCFPVDLKFFTFWHMQFEILVFVTERTLLNLYH